MLEHILCATLEGESAKIRLCDVCYVDIFRPKRSERHIRFHTLDGQFLFRFFGSLESCLEWFEPYGFTQLDSTNVCNLNKIRYVDERAMIAYFSKTVYATISRGNKPKVNDFPKEKLADF